MLPKTSHQELIVDQFSKQAIPFSTAKTIADEKALQLLLDITNAGPDDMVLDVACGGGNVVCAFARVVRHATGIDMTPAMLERAARAAAEKQLSNVTWDRGDVSSLPYPDGAFDLVVTRFSFHHFPDPLAVLKEMKRVCAPGGRILVVDMHTSVIQSQADEFNRMELLRDPSHVRALHLDELKSLFPAAGLPDAAEAHYELRDELENLLGRSFPNPGDGERIREIFRASGRDNRLGIPIRQEGSKIHYAYPVAVLAANRP
ncbi:MAG TPA: methyltransferase domain-containing protein [Burkholderiales bacterium]|nr:methyltransferase domain-containing protein [Burkholderiales bacterium]